MCWGALEILLASVSGARPGAPIDGSSRSGSRILLISDQGLARLAEPSSPCRFLPCVRIPDTVELEQLDFP